MAIAKPIPNLETGGIATPLTRHPSSPNFNESIDLDVMSSHAVSVREDILRGLDNYEMNTETMHPFSVKRSESGLRRRGRIIPLIYQPSGWMAEISIGTPPRTFNVKICTSAADMWVLQTGCRGISGHRNFWFLHLVIHIIRVMEGLILYGDSYPGGVNAFFGNALQWTFTWKNYAYIAQSLLEDLVVIYRCYMVWQSYLIIVFPVLLWCATFVCAVEGVRAATTTIEGGLFAGTLAQWIAGFWSMAFSTNLLTTGLLAWRIWWVDRQSRRLRAHQKAHLRHVLRVILDAGMIYSLTLLAAMICYLTKTNGQHVTLDMVAPIIAITFYMVIIRVGLHRPADQSSSALPFEQHSSSGQSANLKKDRRGGIPARVTTLTQTESNAEHDAGRHTPLKSMESIPPIPHDTRLRDEIKLEGVSLSI